MDAKKGLTWILVGLAAAVPAFSQTINSVAGNSSWGLVYNVSVDAAGNLYVADSTKHNVYKIDTLGTTTVVAGSGVAGYSGDGGLATAARLNAPDAAVVAPDGTMYIADYTNDRIRKVAPNGIITTYAGIGAGFAGDGGQASAARLNGPTSLLLNAAGELIFTDVINFRIRKISTAGVITTIAGSGRCPVLSGDGGPATAADACPCFIALGPDGSLYFTDDGDSRFFGYPRIRKVSPTGIITTVAGGGVRGFGGDGGSATAALMRGVGGVAVDSGGTLFISDTLGARIRRVDPAGIITTFAGTGVAGSAGDGGPAVSAQLNSQFGMTIDTGGNLYVADRNNFKIRKISPPPRPAIRPGEPVLTSFLGKAGFASNTYVEIYGSGFSTTSRLWAGSDFNGINAPTALDGISVTVNGRPAFVYFISPAQININTPEDTAVGPVQVQVRTPLGLSNAVTVNRTRVAPTLQTVPAFLIGGVQYVVAQTPDFRSFIGRPNMIGGLSFVAPKPGEPVSIYALGCGSTNPPTQAGVIAAQNSPIAAPFELRIGGVTASVPFAGIVGNTIGLCQINAIIPNLPAGDHPIELIIDGVSNAQNLSIVVGQ